jgi:hypothetical protein
MSPEHRFAVIVLGNRSGVALNKTAEKAMELMLPLKPKDALSKQETPMSASEMANYIGKYVQRDVSFEIFVRDGKLFLKQGSGGELTISKVGENRFTAMAPGSSNPMNFVLVPGADGKIEYFHAGLRAAKKM